MKRILLIVGSFAFLVAGVAQADVIFFDNQDEFDQALIDAGKERKSFWNFKPDALPPGVNFVQIDDNLNIDNHPLNAPGVWLGADGVNHWPDDFDNVTFSSNKNPQGPFEKRGQGGLLYLKPDPDIPLDNNALLANFPEDSFEIFSGRPVDDNHTAMGLELVSVNPNGLPAFLHVTVYDKNGLEKGKFFFSDVQPGQKVFLGILTQNNTIGRVDIWDENGGSEGVSSISVHIPDPSTSALLVLGGFTLLKRRRS